MTPIISEAHRNLAHHCVLPGADVEGIAALIAEHDQQTFLQLRSDLAEQAMRIDKEAFPEILWLASLERARQISEEKFSAPHDDTHVGGELCLAAACYAIPPWFRFEFGGIFNLWPWARSWWKPAKREEDRRRDLVKAIALIVAEDERLGRLDDNIASAKNEEGLMRFG